jgi:hypothetical protein
MEKITGNLQAKNIFGLTHSSKLSLVLQVVFLMSIGIIAILLHARFRSPINIPGHHGIEFMGLLLIGRLSSNLRFASSISSLGIGLLLMFPIFGFRDPLMGFNYMLPGLMLDIYYQMGGSLKKKTLFLAIIAGLAYMTVPFSRLLISLSTGYQYGAFIKHGFVVPFISWFAFGLSGGLLGTGISNIFTKFLDKYSK